MDSNWSFLTFLQKQETGTNPESHLNQLVFFLRYSTLKLTFLFSLLLLTSTMAGWIVSTKSSPCQVLRNELKLNWKKAWTVKTETNLTDVVGSRTNQIILRYDFTFKDYKNNLNIIGPSFGFFNPFTWWVELQFIWYVR